MTDRIEHDPRTKQQIKDRLYHFLYDPVQRKFDLRLKHLIVANAKALSSSQDGFMYRNHWYTLSPDQPQPRPSDRLVPALRPEMDAFLRDRHQLNSYEIPYVLNYINQVLNSSDDMQDYLRAFPEPLHRPLNEMIESCPCRSTKLPPETIEELQERNHIPIELIKQRLVTNLLLQ